MISACCNKLLQDVRYCRSMIGQQLITLNLAIYLVTVCRILSVCSEENYEKLNQSPFLCLDAVYITTLLRKGYGFPDSQFLQVTHKGSLFWFIVFLAGKCYLIWIVLNAFFQIARKINNVEVSWALGAALHMLDDIV